MAIWYIDNTVGSSGAGTSWGAAWKDFSNIVWASVAAGDFIQISGGAAGASQTYSTSVLTIGKSGTAGNPITITNGQDPSHSGTVIIDGSTSTNISTTDSIIYTNGFTYLVIDGGPSKNIVVQNTFGNCVHIANATSGTILVQNLLIHTGAGQTTLTTSASTTSSATLHFLSVPSDLQSAATSGLAITDQTHPASIPAGTPPGKSVNFSISATSTTVVLNASVASVASGDVIIFAFNARGIRIENNSGATITVQNCYIDTPNSTTAQTDAMFTTGNSGTVVVQNNIIIVNNMDSSGHSDCIQSFEDTAITFRQNILLHPNGGYNNHGFIVSDVNAGGTVLFYDNIIYMGYIPGNVSGLPETAILREFQTAGKTGTVTMYNNTVIAGCVGFDAFESAGTMPAGDLFKNNIIYLLPMAIAAYNLENGNLTTPANTDYNLVYANDAAKLVFYNPSGATIAAVRGTTSLSSGLVYFEMQLGFNFASGNSLLGIGNSTQSLTNYLGNSANGIGWWWSDGNLYLNTAIVSTHAVPGVPGDVIGFAVDFTHSHIWVYNWTNPVGWNGDVIGNQNPAGNVGGVSFSSITGPDFIMASEGGAGDYVILNAGGTAFAGTAPSGFSAWGTTTTFNSGAIGANGVLVAPYANIVGVGYETFATWKTAGYDTHGVNADPKFAVSVPPINALVAAGTFEILTGSGALNAGLTEATVTVDYYGATRPQQTSYAIGAFEPNLLQSQACL